MKKIYIELPFRSVDIKLYYVNYGEVSCILNSIFNFHDLWILADKTCLLTKYIYHHFYKKNWCASQRSRTELKISYYILKTNSLSKKNIVKTK